MTARISAPARWRFPAWGLGLSLFLATFLVYGPALGGGFIWDDDAHVTKLGLQSLAGLGRIWFVLGATQQYYPVLHSFFWLEHRLWGDAALGYHLVNVGLHATAACLFARVLQRLFEAAGGAPSRSWAGAAWLAAFLFALHPIAVESVAWISEQKNTLSTVFYLCSALAYLRFDQNRQGRTYFLALGLFLLALLSKSVTVTLPAALLVMFWWQRGRLSWSRDVVPLLPWFVVGAAAGLTTAWVERTYIGAEGSDFALSGVEHGLLAGRVAWFYLGKLVWPVDLIFVYHRWTVDAAVPWQYLFPAALLAALAGLWLTRRRGRGPLAGALFFVGTLFPALGFVNVYPFVFSYVADHFQYLASLGIFALAAAAWRAWRARAEAQGNRPEALLAKTTVGAVLAGLACLTWQQAGLYARAETLYRATLARNPAAFLMYACLGKELDGQGRLPEAISEYQMALRLRPDYVQIHYDLGVVLAATGRNREAAAEYEQALKFRPFYVEARDNLGVILMEEGRLPEAVAEFRQALHDAPGHPETNNNLGNALVQLGRPKEAIAYYAIALQVRPNFPEVYYDLGGALAMQGQLPEAIAAYQAALRLKPDYAEPHYGLGIALASSGQLSEAMAEYQAALRIRPDYGDAHANLGGALAYAGRLPEAIEQFQEALRSEPTNPVIHYHLGLALRDLGRTGEADAEFAAAARLGGGAP